MGPRAERGAEGIDRIIDVIVTMNGIDLSAENEPY